MLLGFGLMANAALALQFSDSIETALGMTPSKDEEMKLREVVPRLSVIEKEEK